MELEEEQIQEIANNLEKAKYAKGLVLNFRSFCESLSQQQNGRRRSKDNSLGPQKLQKSEDFQAFPRVPFPFLTSRENNLHDEGVGAFASVLAEMPELVELHLNLRWNYIGNEGARMFGKAVNNKVNLEVLHTYLGFRQIF